MGSPLQSRSVVRNLALETTPPWLWMTEVLSFRKDSSKVGGVAGGGAGGGLGSGVGRLKERHRVMQEVPIAQVHSGSALR